MRRDALTKNNHYSNYKNKNGWNSLLPARQETVALKHEKKTDVVIIGAGYTGIAAAKRWHQVASNDDITVIDASTIGEGNPGRNSGFLLEISLANDATSKDMQRMSECNKLISETMEKIIDSIAHSDINCQIYRTGTYRAAAGSVGIKALKKYQNFLEKSELEHEYLNKVELKERIGTDFYQAGLFSPHCYLAQPAALIRALAESLPDEIHLYENTPALEIKKDHSYWRIKTPNAPIKAKKVIIANNAFCGQLGLGKSYVSTIYTYAGLTEILDQDTQEFLGTEKDWGILPTHRLGSTLRKTADNRLMIRSLYDYGAERNNTLIAKKLLRSLKSRFPNLKNVKFESVWGGTTGFTYNGGPLWGEIDSNIYISSGCNGGGIVKGTLFGELLADLANNHSVPDINKLFGSASWMPPEPFRKIGFKLISMIERIRAKDEI
ncbi:MAG: FAD-binding oxidoreductase [Pseudomonadota bacterium]|nr:FAD-binding oxidoreductase [Pseudomonadota bacterium]